MFRWLIFFLLVTCQVIECIAASDTEIKTKPAKIMYGVGYAIISVIIFVISSLIALALYMFISIVSQTPQLKQDLNVTPILL